MDTRHTRHARAFIEASRGHLHPYLSTDGAYADMVADAHMAAVNGQSCPFDTRRDHGPVQWLEAAPASAVPRHEAVRLFTPVDVMPGQLGFGDA